MRITTLAAREPVSQPTMSTLLKRLEKRGLVTRTADPDDARASLVIITDSGRALLTERSQSRSHWIASRLAKLDAESRATVADAVALLLAAIE